MNNSIILCGFMGAGKTSVGLELAKQLNYEFVDTDRLIEEEQKLSIKEIFDNYGEKYFRDLEYEICKNIIKMENTVISTGGGLMTYKRNVNIIKNNAKIIFLDASFPIICKRIAENSTRPLFNDIEKARELYKKRKEKYIKASDYVINGDMPIEDTVKRIREIVFTANC